MGERGMPDEVRQEAREAVRDRLPFDGRSVVARFAADAAAEVAYAAGRADERTRIVAWLNKHRSRKAHRIERGEHLDD